MDTKLYDLEEAQDHPLWAQELYNPDACTETDDTGLQVLFIRTRPVHPKKFTNFSTRMARRHRTKDFGFRPARIF